MIINWVFIFLTSFSAFAGFGQDTLVLVEILRSSLNQLEELHDLADKTGKTLGKIQFFKEKFKTNLFLL